MERERGRRVRRAVFKEAHKDERQPPLGGCRSCTSGACVPVSRIWSTRSNIAVSERGGHHLSGTIVADRLKRPTCTASPRVGGDRWAAFPDGGRDGATWPCTPWGLPGRSRRRERRCALTAPFHPLPTQCRLGRRDCSLLHVPSAPRRSGAIRLPVRKHGALWCSDFPHRRPEKTGATER